MSDSGSEDGLATPAALITSAALAILAVAGMSASLTQLKLAKADFHITEVEETLAGAQERAGQAMLAGVPPALADELSGESLTVRMEPESAKASVVSIILMDDKAFSVLGVTDPEALKDRLKRLSIAQALGDDLEAEDTSPIWQACARSLISPLGLSDELHLPPARGTAANAGELWRVQVSNREGWIDDRVVRFTGDAKHPAATVARRFGKSIQTGPRCETLLAKAG